MISTLRLQNFRSYKDDVFEFSPGVNIIIGPNASGKTNIVEALMILSTGSSFRASDVSLINSSSEWSRLEASIDNNQRIVKLEKNDNDQVDKSFLINTQKFKRLGFTKTIPIVLFEPNHMLTLTTSPDKRRQFMDDILERTSATFKSLRLQYQRALAQRNRLLKSHLPDPTRQLFAWNLRISQLGERVVNARYQLIDRLNKDAVKLYRRLSHTKKEAAFMYKTELPLNNYASSLLRELENDVDKELERGFTMHGPHRDDLIILLDNTPVQEIASRGETRTLLLVCKIFEAELVEESRNARPTILLDDVFSELDGSRRRFLANFLKNHQTFITTTDADIVSKHFTEATNIIPLNP